MVFDDKLILSLAFGIHSVKNWGEVHAEKYANVSPGYAEYRSRRDAFDSHAVPKVLLRTDLLRFHHSHPDRSLEHKHTQ
jgi:hypothetical protein